MSLKALVAHGLKWQILMITARLLLSLVVFTTLARLLDPADFGLMGLTYVYLMLAGVLADQGIGTALIQRANLRPGHWDSAFWFNLVCASALCIGTIAFASPLAQFLGEPRLARLLRWSSLGIVSSAASSMQVNMFVRGMDFRRPAIRTLVASLAGGGIGVLMAFSGCGVWALVGQQLATSLVGTVFIWTLSSYRPRLRFSWADMRDIFGVSSSVFVNTLLFLVIQRLDQLVIVRFAGAEALGLYVVAGKIPELAKTATEQPIREVSMPALSKLQDDHGRMREVIYRGMRLNAVVMFAVFVGLAFVATDLVPLLLGDKWAAASSLCSLLSIYALINALQPFNFPALLASGLTRQYVALSVANAVGIGIACVVGIRFGVTRLVLGLIANSLIQLIPRLRFLHRGIGVRWMDYCKPWLPPASASLFMVGMIKATAVVVTSGVQPWWRLTWHVTVGAAAYLGFLWIFSRATIRDLAETVREALRRERRRTGPLS